MFQQPKHRLPEGDSMPGFTLTRAHTENVTVYTTKHTCLCPHSWKAWLICTVRTAATKSSFNICPLDENIHLDLTQICKTLTQYFNISIYCESVQSRSQRKRQILWQIRHDTRTDYAVTQSRVHVTAQDPQFLSHDNVSFSVQFSRLLSAGWEWRRTCFQLKRLGETKAFKS